MMSARLLHLARRATLKPILDGEAHSNPELAGFHRRRSRLRSFLFAPVCPTSRICRHHCRLRSAYHPPTESQPAWATLERPRHRPRYESTYLASPATAPDRILAPDPPPIRPQQKTGDWESWASREDSQDST